MTRAPLSPSPILGLLLFSVLTQLLLLSSSRLFSAAQQLRRGGGGSRAENDEESFVIQRHIIIRMQLSQVTPGFFFSHALLL